ncbi:hypothetical protein ZWY2020_034018 [Hordeum vulgare]|nr:hypothetical protein ZWY2020_034018 [Hordeum vulgare]
MRHPTFPHSVWPSVTAPPACSPCKETLLAKFTSTSVTFEAYGIEEKASSARDGQSFRKGNGDHLAVSLTHPSPYTSFGYKHSSKGQVVHWVSKLSRRAQGFREHVTLGPKISETVKGKLSLGAKILQVGGIERVFRKAFTTDKGERLVKALQCYLYTTGGPIANSNKGDVLPPHKSEAISNINKGNMLPPHKMLAFIF